jgi:hypothetical protein
MMTSELKSCTLLRLLSHRATNRRFHVPDSIRTCSTNCESVMTSEVYCNPCVLAPAITNVVSSPAAQCAVATQTACRLLCRPSRLSAHQCIWVTLLARHQRLDVYMHLRNGALSDSDAPRVLYCPGCVVCSMGLVLVLVATSISSFGGRRASGTRPKCTCRPTQSDSIISSENSVLHWQCSLADRMLRSRRAA